MVDQSRKRLAEWALVFLSVGLTYLCIEIGYRFYLYYTYAIIADYSVVAVSARQPRIDFDGPGNVFGPSATSTSYDAVYYNNKNEVVYRHKVRTNNLGWTSRYDYSVAKGLGEYRIAVIGGSTTAAVTNELAWTDVLQDRLNSDRELLTALGVQRFSVLNIGFAGAGMSTVAALAAPIARRFSPDLTVNNFSIDTLALDATIDFKAPAEPDLDVKPAEPEVKENKAPAEPDSVLIDGAEIRLFCSRPPASLSNLDCTVSPLWYVPPGRERSGAEIAEIKQTVARRRLLYAVLLSPRPLALLEILGRPVIPRAQAAETSLSEQQRAQLNSALKALQFIQRVLPHLLMTHNPQTWHAQPLISLQVDDLLRESKAVVSMSSRCRNTCHRRWVPARPRAGTCSMGIGTTRGRKSMAPR